MRPGSSSSPGSADGGLEAVAALAPLGHEPPLLGGEVSVLGEGGVDVVVGDEVGAAVQPSGEPGLDPLLGVEHLDGGVERFVVVGERDDVGRGEELVGHLDESRRAAQQRLGFAVVGAGHGVGGHGGERFGAGEHRTPGADPIGLSQ